NVRPRRIAIPSDAPQGQVVEQWPEPEEAIMDRLVILCVSNGPPAAAPPAMPELRGLPLDQARQALTARQIRNMPQIARSEHAEAEGVVFGQSPEAGTPVEAATPIVLQVSSGP